LQMIPLVDAENEQKEKGERKGKTRKEERKGEEKRKGVGPS